MVVKLGEIWDLMKGRSLRGTSLSTEELAAFDPALPGPARERMLRKRREQEVARDQQDERAEARKDRDNADADAFVMEAWLASREYQRAMAELSMDLTDVRKATQRAYEKAHEREKETQAALEDAQRRAITLPDGRRVYFTRDGRLMAEDEREINDTAVVTAAKAVRERKPDATSYEEYSRRRSERSAAEQEADRLRSLLGRIDTLEQKIRDGKLTPAQLAEARQEKQDIVQALPPDARAEYESLQSVRHGERSISYKTADPLFDRAPELNNDFHQARDAVDRAQTEVDQGAATALQKKVTAVIAPDF